MKYHFWKSCLGAALLLVLLSVPAQSVSRKNPSRPDANLTRYVDPMIGIKGGGGVAIGPSAPFGMAKPGPDCSLGEGNGWRPMHDGVYGFSQIHMSGTGGGPKYGNILLQPFSGPLEGAEHRQLRDTEEAVFGRYSCHYAESDITTEIGASARAVFYRFSYPASGARCLSLDCGFHLGRHDTGYPKEEQYLVGSEVRILSDREIEGYSRVRGGWNGGGAYTVYFYLVADRPFADTRTWKGGALSEAAWQSDSGEGTGALLRFAEDAVTVQVKLGLSNVSCLRARQNLAEQMPRWSLEEVRQNLTDEWEQLLGRVELAPQTPDSLKRMFYTALYHCYLHPIDKRGENPHWCDGEPYYDDYYALWDTFRTALPLQMLLTPRMGSDFVRSLLSTYRHDGFLPDGRSGHSNGRTQGGSNADIVLADAFLKGLPDIDWELALEAVLKDADVPPGGDEEAEGRGGLVEYNTLGYVPYGIPRAGTRTLEYSRCDYSIYLLAKGLGRDSLAARFLQQSGNWKHLFRRDFESNGFKGFIMPKDREGNWLDSIPAYRPGQPQILYTPVTREPKWFCTNWEKFFYEGTGWVYSLIVPHDVPGLIEACGGPETFKLRLDEFLTKGYFSTTNEPAFFAPCLYHWVGRPDLTGEIVRRTVRKEYNDGWKGLPGNDDTGATSAWLAWHLMGLYPVAGQDLYILHAPLLPEVTLHLDGGDFVIRTHRAKASGRAKTSRQTKRPGRSAGLAGSGASVAADDDCYIQSVRLNGEPYPYSTLHHADLAPGGILEIELGPAPDPASPSFWGRSFAP